MEVTTVPAGVTPTVVELAGPAVTADHPQRVAWDPRSPAVLADQVAAYDELRSRCPVAHDEAGAWTLFRHADVLRDYLRGAGAERGGSSSGGV